MLISVRMDAILMNGEGDHRFHTWVEAACSISAASSKFDGVFHQYPPFLARLQIGWGAVKAAPQIISVAILLYDNSAAANFAITEFDTCPSSKRRRGEHRHDGSDKKFFHGWVSYRLVADDDFAAIRFAVACGDACSAGNGCSPQDRQHGCDKKFFHDFPPKVSG